MWQTCTPYYNNSDNCHPRDRVRNVQAQRLSLISPVEDVRFDEWQRQIDLNVIGVMNVIGAFIASVPRHVNLTEITILPTQQAV